MVRSKPWRQKCPALVHHRLLEATSNSPFLVVQQPGPTSFVLKNVNDSKKFKVRIGDPQECNCTGKDGEGLCVHILFVMAKVFRVPHENPMLWQLALMEAEVEQLVSGRLLRGAKKVQNVAVPSAAATDDDERVTRKPLEEDDSCPICCDDLTPDRPMLWCRYGCGNNIHANCFKEYAKHNATNPTPLQCPLCRTRWGSIEDPTTDPSHGVGCGGCRRQICGERYRCAFCTNFNLCHTCFNNPLTHPHHPFDVSIAPGAEFTQATRPVRPTRQTNQDGVGGVGGVLDANNVNPMHRELMMRELGPEDYELLMQLDENNEPPPGSLFKPEEAAALPTITYVPEVTTDYDTCAICLDAFKPQEKLMQLNCNHVFHVDCGMQWLTQSRAVCPIDNQPVVLPRKAHPLPSTGGQGASSATAIPAPDHDVRQITRRKRTGSHPNIGQAQHRFATPTRGKAPTEITGPNNTGGSYRPSVNDLEGLSVGVTAMRIEQRQQLAPSPTMQNNAANRTTATDQPRKPRHPSRPPPTQRQQNQHPASAPPTGGGSLPFGVVGFTFGAPPNGGSGPK